MPAPASMRQAAQFGLEVTYNTPVAVTRRFTSFGLGKSRNMQAASTRPAGQTAVTKGWIAQEDSAFPIQGGVLSYNEVNYLLESVFKKVTATTPAGGTTSRERVYGIDQFAADTFQSFTTEQGIIGGRGGKASGCFVNEWGFEFSSTDDTVAMSGSLLGGKLVDQAMTTAGITTSDYLPVTPPQGKLYYATSWANLQSAPTEVTNAFTANFSVGDRRSLVRYIGNATGGPSDVVETVPGLEFDLTIADEAAPIDTFFTAARAGQTQYFKILFEGSVIETTIKYTFELKLAAVLRDGPGDDDEDGVSVLNFPYAAAYDGRSGKICEVKTINTLTAL
jgi:hypothetical protein